MKLKNLLSTLAIAAVVLMVGCNKDDGNDLNLAPTVISSDPANNASDVVLNKIVTVTFSEEMNPLTLTAATFIMNQGTTPVVGTVTCSGTTASFEPTGDLTLNTTYTCTITTGAENVSGIALENEYVWDFISGSLTAPTVISTTPVNNAVDVNFNKIITATFSEAMDPSTISTTSFTLKHGQTAVEGTVSYTGTTATFTPTTDLLAETIYTATITNEVTNLESFALAGNKVWSFTTGDAPDEILPTITLTDPINNELNVVRNKAIEVSFSEEMDPLTVNTSTFTLMQGTNEVPGVVEYFGTTATFNPTNILVAETVYTATITTEVKDLAGNALAANKEWSFTTVAASTGLAVVDLGTAGNYVILAKSAISTVPTSDITGDLGLSPAAETFITGFALTDATGYATSDQVTGKVYAADMDANGTPMMLTTAVENMLTAYTDAAGRPTPDFLNLGTGNIGGKTLVPGLYKWTTAVTIPTDVTISGGADDVWIFQIAEGLSMSAGVIVTLEGGAQAKNIFWQVAGEAVFDATSHFEGIILSQTAITFKTGASFNGRALAQTAVHLDGNIIVEK